MEKPSETIAKMCKELNISVEKEAALLVWVMSNNVIICSYDYMSDLLERKLKDALKVA